MVRRLSLGKNNHLIYASLLLNPWYDVICKQQSSRPDFANQKLSDQTLKTAKFETRLCKQKSFRPDFANCNVPDQILQTWHSRPDLAKQPSYNQSLQTAKFQARLWKYLIRTDFASGMDPQSLVRNLLSAERDVNLNMNSDGSDSYPRKICGFHCLHMTLHLTGFQLSLVSLRALLTWKFDDNISNIAFIFPQLSLCVNFILCCNKVNRILTVIHEKATIRAQLFKASLA